MDIIGAANNEMQRFITDSQRHETALGGFRSVLAARAAENLSEAEDRELRKACEDFESYFMQMMFREMRKTSFDEDGFLPKSSAEKIFTDMMDEEASKSAARTGGFGLADMMYRQMILNYTANG